MATTAAPITVKQWLELPEEQIERTELIDGEIIDLPKTNSVHEKVKNRLAKKLMLHLSRTGAGESMSRLALNWSQTSRLCQTCQYFCRTGQLP